jgi:hypothetical protein
MLDTAGAAETEGLQQQKKRGCSRKGVALVCCTSYVVLLPGKKQKQTTCFEGAPLKKPYIML